jgi:putative ABC transport system substrate-binding protein
MQRRDFITFIGGAAVAWPVAAQAQKPSLPVIGYLNARQETAHENPIIKQINQALAEMGFVEGRNFTSEYRFADNHRERLAELASDLVRRDVAVIVTTNLPEALAAKAATASIPVLFYTGADPVANGLVASMNLPGGNLTGAVNLNTDLISKRLQLLHELVPTVELIAYLANPTNNKAFADAETNALQRAASALSLRLLVLNASEPAEIDDAFAALARDRVSGLVVGADAYFLTRPNQIADLASRYKIPANYAYREYAAAGGLISYGINRLDGYRIVGTYAGRILRGEKPADLPVQAPTKFELVINLKTAKTLGLTIPPGVLAIADEVIE